MDAQAVFAFARPEPPRPGYWNTTELAGRELVEACQVAGQQDRRVLALYRDTGRAMTPSAVWRRGCDRGERWLLTSVRRSITNLTAQGLLVKLDDKRMGPYGRMEGCWRLRA